jgi:aspartate carbamoyltransferase catalytic subunit
MPSSKSSLINFTNYSEEKINQLFSRALKLKNNFHEFGYSSGPYHSGYRGTAALLFFEPSTRTRFSFEAACSRAGFHPLILDGGIGTSLEKGETVEDTIFNIQSMKPLFFVVRCDDRCDLQNIESKLDVPLINAGWGRTSHPTQALLDALTMIEAWGDIKNKKILFIGDIKHSRVVSSHLELSKKLEYRLGFCGPSEFLPETQEEVSGPKLFHKLDHALEWADAVVALRVQKERHDNENLFLIEDYRENYGLNNKSLNSLKASALILHPGPINYGIELEQEVLSDPRCRILKQVENGVFLREALIRSIFE